MDWKFSPGKLKDRRLELNLSLRDLGKKSGVDRGTISRIENGERTPGADIIAALASALEVSPSHFFEEN